MPPLPQACLRPLPQWGTVLEDPYGLPRLPVLRLDQQGDRHAVRLPRVRGQGVLRTAVPLRILVSAVGFGVLASLVARGFGGTGWVFALLVLSAAVAAIAQQTLP